jgi:hypothetical protein
VLGYAREEGDTIFARLREFLSLAIQAEYGKQEFISIQYISAQSSQDQFVQKQTVDLNVTVSKLGRNIFVAINSQLKITPEVPQQPNGCDCADHNETPAAHFRECSQGFFKPQVLETIDDNDAILLRRKESEWIQNFRP